MQVRSHRVPPCDAIGPDGRRIIIRPDAPTDDVADLARALSLPSTTTVWIDGRPMPGHRPLTHTGLRIGSHVDATTDGGHPPSQPLTADADTVAGADGTAASATTVEATTIDTTMVDAATVDAAMVDTATSAVAALVIGVVSGPACSPWRRLPPGRHVVGRATTADIRIDDPAVEPHHGVLDVEAGGRTTFTQLTGRTPARIDGTPCDRAQEIGVGQTLLLGASSVVLAVRRERIRSNRGSIVASDHDPWRQVVRRGPSTSARTPDDDIEPPPEPAEHRGPPAIGLVGAGIAAAGAGLMAAVLGQPLFALFAAVGAVATLATWAVGSLAAIRRRRAARRDHDRQQRRFLEQLEQHHHDAEERHLDDHLGVADALAIVTDDDARIWERRRDDGPLRTTIGHGTCRVTTGLALAQRRGLTPAALAALERCERLDDVPVPLLLEPGTNLALRGDATTATALARSLVVQLASLYGPTDWRLAIVTDRPDTWTWASWLPHAATGPGVITPGQISTSRADDTAMTVVVTDTPDLLATRTGPLRRFLTATDAACIVITSDATVPAACQHVLDVGTTGTASTGDGTAADGTSGVRPAGISVATALAAARRLAPLLDPEDGDVATALPTDLQLHDLDASATDAAGIVRRWRSHGSDPALAATIGLSTDGTVELDLVRDGPHGLIAGTTGSGKSELLRTMIVALASQVGPDHLTFVLVDFKGGSAFDVCAALPHTVGVVTDLDDGLAARALVSLDAEVRRRERLLRDAGASDLTDYRRRTPDALPRLVVVIDEFASLAKEHPDLLAALVSIAQRGRSLGVHLILATQRPAGVVTDDIRANTNLRLALRLNDRSDAHDVIGDEVPTTFTRSTPGRAAMRLGPDELVVFQTASCTGPARQGSRRLRVDLADDCRPGERAEVAGPSELDLAVGLIRDAAVLADIEPPHRPWVEPLPAVLLPGEVCEAVGVIDDPANQCQHPLRWDHTTGNLLLVGALGSGTTSTAITLAHARVATADPSAVHVYVIDAGGARAWDDVAELDHVAAIVRLHETERLMRLLARLNEEIDRHGSGAGPRHETLLIVDGLGPTRAAAEEFGLDRVLHEGPAAGIVTCATTDGASSSALTATVAARWVFHVGDPSVAAALHVTPVPAGTPGRLRVASTGLEAQVVHDPQRIAAITSRPGVGGPPPIEVLPDWVDPSALTDRVVEPRGGVLALPVGIAATDLSTAHLQVPSGDHVFVGGGARTGTSTALRQLAAAWAAANPAGVVVDIGTNHDWTTFEIADRPTLVVVDDADRVADPTGVLAEITSGAWPGVTIAAGSRLEAARVAYGHWIREVARCRCGMIFTAAGEVDGELLGAVLPRRPVIAARPGLAWVIDATGHRLVQVAGRLRA
ncbi:MAG: FtsK/SpoIIIE domain-containing protein [Ilumatobacteraceae bacterium]